MNLDKLNEMGHLYARIASHNAKIAEAETVRAKAEAELARSEQLLAEVLRVAADDTSAWDQFSASYPKLRDIVTATFEALAESGEAPAPQISKTPSSIPPLPTTAPAAKVEDKPEASAPTPLAAVENVVEAQPAATPVEAKPVLRPVAEQPIEQSVEENEFEESDVQENETAISSGAPETSEVKKRKPRKLSAKIANAPQMLVGPLNVVIPNRPMGSESRKSNLEYKQIWGRNYQDGFDRAMDGRPAEANDAAGPSRDGRLKGYDDGLAYKAALENGEMFDQSASDQDLDDQSDAPEGFSNASEESVSQALPVETTAVEPEPEFASPVAASADIFSFERSINTTLLDIEIIKDEDAA